MTNIVLYSGVIYYISTEYGAPTVNLTCPIITQDTQTVVHMDWLPTGSLTLEEMLSDDYKLVSSCKAQWTCSNGTTTSEKVAMHLSRTY